MLKPQTLDRICRAPTNNIKLAFQLFLVGIVADLIAANRRLLEDVRGRLRRIELGDGRPHGGETRDGGDGP